MYKGYIYDVETGLYYCNSRYYSPELRRFISPDSIEYLDSESINGLNLYAYCMNDPINYADTSGHFVISTLIIGAIIGAAIGAFSYTVSQGISYAITGEWSWSWKEFAGSVLGGAIGGLGIGLGTTILTSGIGNVVEAAFAGNIDSFGDVLLQFATGGVLGGVGYGISKGIAKLFADKKILGILGGLSNNTKVNKRLAKAGFSHMKIGREGFSKVYNAMYKKLGFETLEKGISYGYDIIVGFIF